MKKVTQEQIKEWKDKHKDVYLIEVKGADDEEFGCYVRRPKRAELQYASTVSSGGKDGIKFSEQILRSCWLDGDEEIQTSDSLFLAAAGKLDTLIEIAEASIKKL